MPVVVLYTKYTRLDRAAFTKSRTRGTRHGSEDSGWQHACTVFAVSAGPSLATRNTSVFWMHPHFCLGTPIHTIRGHRRMRLVLPGPLMGSPNFDTDFVLRGDAVSRARTRSTLHHAACVTRLLHIAFLFPQGVDHIPSASRGDFANTPWAQGNDPQHDSHWAVMRAKAVYAILPTETEILRFAQFARRY